MLLLRYLSIYILAIDPHVIIKVFIHIYSSHRSSCYYKVFIHIHSSHRSSCYYLGIYPYPFIYFYFPSIQICILKPLDKKSKIKKVKTQKIMFLSHSSLLSIQCPSISIHPYLSLHSYPS